MSYIDNNNNFKSLVTNYEHQKRNNQNYESLKNSIFNMYKDIESKKYAEVAIKCWIEMIEVYFKMPITNFEDIDFLKNLIEEVKKKHLTETKTETKKSIKDMIDNVNNQNK